MQGKNAKRASAISFSFIIVVPPITSFLSKNHN